MKTINVRLNEYDSQAVEHNLSSISTSLGYNINLSRLLRYVLLKTKTKKDLFDLGFISVTELYDSPRIVKGKKVIKLRSKRVSK